MYCSKTSQWGIATMSLIFVAITALWLFAGNKSDIESLFVGWASIGTLATLYYTIKGIRLNEKGFLEREYNRRRNEFKEFISDIHYKNLHGEEALNQMQKDMIAEMKSYNEKFDLSQDEKAKDNECLQKEFEKYYDIRRTSNINVYFRKLGDVLEALSMFDDKSREQTTRLKTLQSELSEATIYLLYLEGLMRYSWAQEFSNNDFRKTEMELLKKQIEKYHLLRFQELPNSRNFHLINPTPEYKEYFYSEDAFLG